MERLAGAHCFVQRVESRAGARRKTLPSQLQDSNDDARLRLALCCAWFMAADPVHALNFRHLLRCSLFAGRCSPAGGSTEQSSCNCASKWKVLSVSGATAPAWLSENKHRDPFAHGLFQVRIQPLLGIAFRAVAGLVKQLYLAKLVPELNASSMIIKRALGCVPGQLVAALPSCRAHAVQWRV